jgi:hypothetical protein
VGENLYRILEFSAKGAVDAAGTWRDAGVSLVSPRFFEVAERLRSVAREGEFDDLEVFQEMLREGDIFYGTPLPVHFDAGNPVGLSAACAAFVQAD